MPIINATGTDFSWRLVHNGVKVLALFSSTGKTETIHNLFEAQTEDECNARVAALGLIPLPVEVIVAPTLPSDPNVIDGHATVVPGA